VLLSGLRSVLKSLPGDLLRENVQQAEGHHVCGLHNGTNSNNLPHTTVQQCKACEIWLTDQWNLAHGIEPAITAPVSPITPHAPKMSNIITASSSSCTDLNSTHSSDVSSPTLTSQSARSASSLPPIANKKVNTTTAESSSGVSRLFNRYFKFGSASHKSTTNE
jgi:hypothetical protein